MKKTLLAAALTVGFAGVAQAETQVTLYGLIDTGLGYNKVEFDDVLPGVDYEAKKFGLVSGVQSGSRFGLRGTEDLGNGLQAIFQLEHGFDSTTGFGQQGGRQFGRHATIGLQSDSWGRLDFGRQTNIASKYFGDTAIASPFATSFGQANIGATFGSANTNRWDNMIMYQTPNFSGFQFGIGYSFHINGSQPYEEDITGVSSVDQDTTGITAGLRYANGPLGVALTYDQVNSDWAEDVLGAGTDKVQAWNIGASYDFEIVKVHAGFGQTRDGMMGLHSYAGISAADLASVIPAAGAVDGVLFAEDLDANLYTLGLSAPLGAGKIMASWGMTDFDDFQGIDMKKQHIYSLGYTYDLSKRTNVYVLGSYADNLYGIDNSDSTVFAVGLRHRF